MADSDVTISAKPRTDFGKGAARRYRREGFVPAVTYGSGSELHHVLLPEHELGLALRIPRVVLNLDFEGTSILVAPRDVQRDPVKQELIHLDLIMLSAADVQERHAYSAALAKAEQLAEEAGLDALAAGSIIEEAAANEEDLDHVANRIVEILEEQNKQRAEASAAAEAAEAAAEAEGAEEGEAAEAPEAAETAAE